MVEAELSGRAMRVEVQVITQAATKDSLTPAAYREIYYELRKFDEPTGTYGLSQRKFAELLKSEMSHAVWGKYDAGEMDLTRRMKSELRQAVGLPALPPTVDEAVKVADPDATVVRVGDEAIDYVVLTSEARFKELRYMAKAQVRESFRRAEARKRPKRVRPVARPEQEQRREKLGVSWSDVIEAGLKALEVPDVDR